jgi:hypothetical protein
MLSTCRLQHCLPGAVNTIRALAGLRLGPALTRHPPDEPWRAVTVRCPQSPDISLAGPARAVRRAGHPAVTNRRFPKNFTLSSRSRYRQRFNDQPGGDMTNPYTPPPAGQPAPKWARKRYVLPALGLAFFLGIGAGAGDSQPKNDTKPAAATPQPTVTVTATATVSPAAEPEPAPTVTETVEVEVTTTVTAEPADDTGTGAGSSNNDSSGGSVYYENCAAARAAGAAPVHRGDPGYGSHLDRDNDGTGCDWG